jgi:hypothetical protein
MTWFLLPRHLLWLRLAPRGSEMQSGLARPIDFGLTAAPPSPEDLAAERSRLQGLQGLFRSRALFLMGLWSGVLFAVIAGFVWSVWAYAGIQPLALTGLVCAVLIWVGSLDTLDEFGQSTRAHRVIDLTVHLLLPVMGFWVFLGSLAYAGYAWGLTFAGFIVLSSLGSLGLGAFLLGLQVKGAHRAADALAALLPIHRENCEVVLDWSRQHVELEAYRAAVKQQGRMLTRQEYLMMKTWVLGLTAPGCSLDPRAKMA